MKLGLALSGGGLRGAAHVGVLKALLEKGIKPDMIAGTSAGSLVGALYATGMSPEDMLKLVPSINKSMLDINVTGILKYLFRLCPEFDGFIKGDRFEEYVKDLTQGKKLYQTDLPFATVTVDIETGCKLIYASKELDLSSESKARIYQLPTIDPIYKAVRASCSVPIIFQSVKAYHYNLVDGGLRDNIPVKLLKDKMGADKVIAVNIGFTGQRDSKITSLSEYLMQTIDIMGGEGSRPKLLAADYIIKPKIYNIRSTDFDKIEECIERGYEATKKVMDKIEKCLEC